jgi:hypothetical protein
MGDCGGRGLVIHEVFQAGIFFEFEDPAAAPCEDGTEGEIEAGGNFGEGFAEINALADDFLLFRREVCEAILDECAGFLKDGDVVRGWFRSLVKRGRCVTGGVSRGVCRARCFAGFLECFAGFVESDLEKPAAKSGETDGAGGLEGIDNGALPRVVNKVFIAENSKEEELEILLPVDAGGFNGRSATVVFGTCGWGVVWGISGIGRHPDGSGGKEFLEE